MTTQAVRDRALASKRSANFADGLAQKARLDRPDTEIAKIAKRIEDMPETMRRTYLRAVSGRSRLAAIKAFCSECVGWEREEVRRCTAPACPLYPYRPFMDTNNKTKGATGHD